MFKGLLRKLGLGPAEATIADRVITDAANGATHGAAGEVVEAAEAVRREVERRRKARQRR